jgi:hypothetical protein
VVTPVLNGKLTAKGIMKNHLVAVLVLTLLAAFNSQLSTAFAQGSLTPPGAPAPTMKTLAQIEPRTPVDALTRREISATNSLSTSPAPII